MVARFRKSNNGSYSQQNCLLVSKQTTGTLCLVDCNISIAIKKLTHFTIFHARSSPRKNEGPKGPKIGYLRGFYPIYKKHKGVSICAWIPCSSLVRGVYNVVFPRKVDWWPRNWSQIGQFWRIWNDPVLWSWALKIRYWLKFATKMTSDIKTNLWDPLPGWLEHFYRNKKVYPFHHFSCEVIS